MKTCFVKTNFANFADTLDSCKSFACIFSLVKKALESTLRRRRVGLILGLSDLPLHVGAFHQIGSNFIIMNKRLVDYVVRTCDQRLINAYIFHVLLHEYIHSLGCINEQETEILTYAISEKILGPEHPSTWISKYGVDAVLSKIGSIGLLSEQEDETDEHELQGFGPIDMIEDFETDNLNYFG